MIIRENMMKSGAELWTLKIEEWTRYIQTNLVGMKIKFKQLSIKFNKYSLWGYVPLLNVKKKII